MSEHNNGNENPRGFSEEEIERLYIKTFKSQSHSEDAESSSNKRKIAHRIISSVYWWFSENKGDAVRITMVALFGLHLVYILIYNHLFR